EAMLTIYQPAVLRRLCSEDGDCGISSGIRHIRQWTGPTPTPSESCPNVSQGGEIGARQVLPMIPSESRATRRKPLLSARSGIRTDKRACNFEYRRLGNLRRPSNETATITPSDQPRSGNHNFFGAFFRVISTNSPGVRLPSCYRGIERA